MKIQQNNWGGGGGWVGGVGLGGGSGWWGGQGDVNDELKFL